MSLAAGKPMLLKYVHKQVSWDTGLKGVLRATLSSKDTEATVLSQDAHSMTVSKTKTLRDPALLKMMKIPEKVQFVEKWQIETGKGAPRMLMTTTIDLSLYKMQIGTMYESVATPTGHTDLCVQTKVAFFGLESNPVLLSMVTTTTQKECGDERKHEKKCIHEFQKLSASLQGK